MQNSRPRVRCALEGIVTTHGNTSGQISWRHSGRSAAWIARVTSTLALVPMGFMMACATSESDGSTRVLTPEEDAEYIQSIEAARQMLDKGEARESLPLLQRSEELKPEAFAVHNNFCVAYGMLGQREDAVVACERAIEIDPASRIAKNNLNWVSGLAPAAIQK
jgi:Flp pilus assembly protein TadD